jgi:hypothetical protein
MKTVSKAGKELIQKILMEESKRISLADIFNDPWILKETSRTPLKVNFNRLVTFSKFSKVSLPLVR